MVETQIVLDNICTLVNSRYIKVNTGIITYFKKLISEPAY